MLPLSRAQGFLRSFLGLGNRQLDGIEEVIYPMLEVTNFLLQPQDEIMFSLGSGVASPGLGGTQVLFQPANINLQNYFEILSCAIQTNGPATSGSVTVNANLSLGRGGGFGTVALIADTLLPRLPGVMSIAGTGRLRGNENWLDPRGAIPDTLVANLSNAAASVGGASFSLLVLYRLRQII